MPLLLQSPKQQTPLPWWFPAPDKSHISEEDVCLLSLINLKAVPCDSGMSDQFSENKYKIGFFGGSFDPIHQGHVSVALATINKFNLHKVLVCPAFFAPLPKQDLFSLLNTVSLWLKRCAKNIQT